MKGFLIVTDEPKNDVFVRCLRNNIHVFRYSREWTLKRFNDELDAALCDVPPKGLSLCGWMFHGMLDKQFSLVADCPVDVMNPDMKQWQHLIDIINKLAKYTDRMDFIACCLFKNRLMRVAKDVIVSNTPGLAYAYSETMMGSLEGACTQSMFDTYLRQDSNDGLMRSIVMP